MTRKARKIWKVNQKIANIARDDLAPYGISKGKYSVAFRIDCSDSRSLQNLLSNIRKLDLGWRYQIRTSIKIDHRYQSSDHYLIRVRAYIR